MTSWFVVPLLSSAHPATFGMGLQKWLPAGGASDPSLRTVAARRHEAQARDQLSASIVSFVMRPCMPVLC